MWFRRARVSTDSFALLVFLTDFGVACAAVKGNSLDEKGVTAGRSSYDVSNDGSVG